MRRVRVLHAPGWLGWVLPLPQQPRAHRQHPQEHLQAAPLLEPLLLLLLLQSGTP
jgi:hypothetical protein